VSDVWTKARYARLANHRGDCHALPLYIQLPIRHEWSEAKRRANPRRHGLDFADAPAVFAGVTYTFEDTRFDYAERRQVTLGLLRGLVVSIVHTETRECIRVVSFRKATEHEEAILFASFEN
jgi:uncharacterized DUF497 family protein